MCTDYYPGKSSKDGTLSQRRKQVSFSLPNENHDHTDVALRDFHGRVTLRDHDYEAGETNMHQMPCLTHVLRGINKDALESNREIKRQQPIRAHGCLRKSRESSTRTEQCKSDTEVVRCIDVDNNEKKIKGKLTEHQLSSTGNPTVMVWLQEKNDIAKRKLRARKRQAKIEKETVKLAEKTRKERQKISEAAVSEWLLNKNRREMIDRGTQVVAATGAVYRMTKSPATQQKQRLFASVYPAASQRAREEETLPQEKIKLASLQKLSHAKRKLRKNKKRNKTSKCAIISDAVNVPGKLSIDFEEWLKKKLLSFSSTVPSKEETELQGTISSKRKCKVKSNLIVATRSNKVKPTSPRKPTKSIKTGKDKLHGLYKSRSDESRIERTALTDTKKLDQVDQAPCEKRLTDQTLEFTAKTSLVDRNIALTKEKSGTYKASELEQEYNSTDKVFCSINSDSDNSSHLKQKDLEEKYETVQVTASEHQLKDEKSHSPDTQSDSGIGDSVPQLMCNASLFCEASRSSSQTTTGSGNDGHDDLHSFSSSSEQQFSKRNDHKMTDGGFEEIVGNTLSDKGSLESELYDFYS